jgi:hypothetical protein
MDPMASSTALERAPPRRDHSSPRTRNGVSGVLNLPNDDERFAGRFRIDRALANERVGKRPCFTGTHVGAC